MLLFDRMNVAVLATDTDLRITAWSGAAEKIYGWPAEQVIGRPIREVIGPLIIADEREETHIRLERGEKSPITIIEHLRHDGTTVTAQSQGAGYPSAGTPRSRSSSATSPLSGSHRPGSRGRVRSGSGNALDSAMRRDPKWRNFE